MPDDQPTPFEPFEPSSITAYADAVATFLDNIRPLDENVLAYRRRLEGEWSPTVAEQMADRVHELFMAQFISAARGISAQAGADSDGS